MTIVAKRRPAPAQPAAIGPTAARLATALLEGDVICIAADEPRAIALAAALEGASSDALVIHLPAPDALPGEPMPCSPGNVGARHMALHTLVTAERAQRVALIFSIEAAITPVPDRAMMLIRPLQLETGCAATPEALTETLSQLGYYEDDRIDEPGEMRGTIELFPTTASAPVRLDFADDRLVSIRIFDPITQRSIEEVNSIVVAPAIWPPRSSDWVSPLAHLPGAALALDPGLADRHAQLLQLLEDSGRDQGIAISAEDWAKLVAGASMIDILPGGEVAGERYVEQQRPDRAVLRAISRHLASGDRVVLAGAKRDLRYLARRIDRTDAPPLVPATSWSQVLEMPPGTLASLGMPIEAGWRDAGIVVIAAGDVLGSRAAAPQSRTVATNPLADLGRIHVGDVVVHEDYGIGVIRGLQPVDLPDRCGDMIRIQYAKDTQRLVPVEEADRLWRYGGDADAVTLDRLDGSTWEKRRSEIHAAIISTAEKLTAHAAERAARKAMPVEAPSAAYERFSGRFPFTATRDQLSAIEAVRDDLASGRPMDRLIVGDVGYGKTEVALRAAAIAALAGHQVAMVAPTTVLARQHLETFRRRFDGQEVIVAGLSRLSSTSEAKAVKVGLADGSIRIVIGTQALTAQNVRYADLALVIIDEEQRFGAADKAKLRRLVSSGHVLTLTATPIPRTLQSALVGLQDISVIATPPARRQAIRTAVGPFDPVLLRAALLRERSRGGQSFVVVPRIEDLAPLADQLSRMVPELQIRQAHGKMKASAIDEAMVGFANGDGDILLATNIIEAGLDVPRANLMCVMHADRFGLSQLHQLRGRVGRGARRGTILLMTRADREIPATTMKRLKTLEAFDQLGAGFAISAQDLDQRGAGDLFGEDQAGHVKVIGVELYQHLLAQALAAADGGIAERWSPELRIAGEASLPEDWIAEEEIRLNLYIRLARLSGDAAVDNFADELEDRFGALPEPAQRLIALARIRALARTARIARVDAGPGGVALTPRPEFAGDMTGLERKGDRLLRRGDPGSDPFRVVTELLHNLIAT